jgi:hypothetical protein
MGMDCRPGTTDSVPIQYSLPIESLALAAIGPRILPRPEGDTGAGR